MDGETNSKVKSRFTKKLIGLVKVCASKVVKAVKGVYDSTIGKIAHIIMAVDWKNVKLSVYVRWIAMVILVVNMFLEKAGMNPIPFSGTDVYEMVSDVLTAIIFILNTYKNNSTSKEAIQADKILDEMRNQQDALDSEDYTTLK